MPARSANILPQYRRFLALFLALGALALAAIVPRQASAQATTFSLDRLRIGGDPDDGVAVWRPQMGEKTRLFGQFDLGFSLNPFRIEHHIQDNLQAARMATVSGAPVQTQLTGYFDIGIEIFDRVALQVMFPATLVQTGNATSSLSVPAAKDSVDLAIAAAGDTRFDIRAIPLRTSDRKFKLGVELFLNAPSGNEKSFTGDKSTSGGLSIAPELDFKSVQLTLNTGFNFRPNGHLNDFTVQHEWTWGFGAFLPLRDQTIRLGAEIFGSTGISGSNSTFNDENTPLEWMLEARFAVDKKKRLYVGGNAGTRLTTGYAPDFRVGALIGYWFNVKDEEPKEEPNIKTKPHNEEKIDTDHDGYPDDEDLCPTEPEDGKPPLPTDGCPAPPDKDGDGIPDASDKCPDVPEDKDGIDDWDGCPEDDADKDGIPDAQDKCPKEPGEANTKDPSKNGCPQFIRRITGSNEIQVLKQIQFETGSARIRKDSYPIMDEVWRLLSANPEITLLSIEGHTDNVGGDEMNMQLSKDRAKSCLDYLTQKGIDAKRLTSDGFGKTKPIDTNDTPEGRQNNRRVEFHIKNQIGGATIQEQQGPPPKPGSDTGPPPQPKPGGAQPGGD
jgi:OOP family OmpA-OmpF porin